MNYFFKKLNDEPIKIERVEDEHEEANDFKPSFWFENRRWFLENFTSTVTALYCGGEWPEHIHAFQSDETHSSFTDPLYLEFLDENGQSAEFWDEGGRFVNVYREREEVAV